MITLRITSDGRILGLWDDSLELTRLGSCAVSRASHVEFDDRSQTWLVLEAFPSTRLRLWLQIILKRPFGIVLHIAASRSDALDWEHTHFQPGGQGWRDSR